MKHTINTPTQTKKISYSARLDRYTSIPSPYIQQLIASNTPRKRIDDVIHIYDGINGTWGNGMASAMAFHGLKSQYGEDYLNLLLEEPEKYADRIALLEKQRKSDLREERLLEKQAERERKAEERLNRDFLKATRKFKA
jgi:hypothetical protein